MPADIRNPLRRLIDDGQAIAPSPEADLTTTPMPRLRLAARWMVTFVQGAICGLAVGAAQAVVLRARLGRLALAWPPALAAIWALGWTITTLGGIQVDQRFTVFGSFGAITVTALTAVLPLIINRAGNSAS
jgi:hypothetical protein